MKHFKKIIAVTAVAFAAFTASAQNIAYFKTAKYPVIAVYSNTSKSSNNLFTTDADNFIDVNEWSTVKPVKAFGMFSASTTNAYDIGFAKQFKKIYWGTYFSGDFGDYLKTKTETDTDTIVQIKEGISDETKFSFYNLFGFGNVGLRVGFNYYNFNSTNDDATKQITDNAAWGIDASAGWNKVKLGKLDVKPWVLLKFNFNNTYENSDSDDSHGSKSVTDSTVTADNRSNKIALAAGGSIILSKSSTMETSLLTSLGWNLYFPIDKDFNKTTINVFELPVEFRMVIKPTDKLSFGVKTWNDFILTFNNNGISEVKTTQFDLKSRVFTGIQYDTLKKVVFNAGIAFIVPWFNLVHTEKTDYSSTITKWDGEDARVSFTTGFQFNPIKNLSFDCNWNILEAVFGNNFTTTFTEGDAETDVFWKNLNKLLVHNISIQVSYKF
ncbi:hypothetical protein SAMN04487977_101237 [Treponema bryantii]|uniref:Uncharacterized protein n=1 Tax=Treponema bryantii TaxID=163 RepID=A0A1H9A7N5_9SPIR|nr:hypothetical protein [Treponema bryantii]SEP72742.1 hypothetical protein SAMN04487977_101237 [Treponema bryantii]